MRAFRRYIDNREGSTAIEFAILALPFLVLIFAIIELAVMYFVDSGLDAALHKAVRQVRIGTAKTAAWDINKFKTAVCTDLSYSFSCNSNLKVRATVITDMNSVTRVSGSIGGTYNVVEDFNIGDSGDYVLVQAFLPWDPVIKLYPISSGRLTDGRYVLATAELFKNEPF
ncbi:pilus assembly protein [Rhizobium sp. KVB221]|uniref:Pilus assembly protein n=1 Tax=Rhizobium setariae TaxID=2801340 RepID=A0A936YJ73_9HYPH|nr:TadE/TadG family type IV pilus assembly protein [Rhizobium setariae]MBL0371245.1 pilus assembly protein [Rhizobium setariae]